MSSPRALSIAALGMSAQQKTVDNIANNLANVNTTSFKKSTIAFQDLFYQNVATSRRGMAGGRSSGGPRLQMGHGSKAVATVRNFSQGALEETGGSIDMAINGAGFFQVERSDGTIAYTRDGNFTMDSDGGIITHSGLRLADQIDVPEDTVGIHISQDGVVTAQLSGDRGDIDLGQIELAKFVNPGGLEALGDNLFGQTRQSGEPFYSTPGMDGFGSLQQGFLEQSNVDIVHEMVGLIQAQRAYETNSKMVQTAEDMMAMTNSIKR